MPSPFATLDLLNFSYKPVDEHRPYRIRQRETHFAALLEDSPQYCRVCEPDDKEEGSAYGRTYTSFLLA